MHINRSSLLGGEKNRLLCLLLFKYRQILIIFLLVLIFFSGVIAVQAFMSMEKKLKNLSQYEPIYVLKINRDIDQGEAINSEDLSVIMFYKHEFEKLSVLDEKTGLSHSSLISCDLSSDEIYPSVSPVGRVANIPILKDSVLRTEYLAPPGTLPGLINLLAEDHSLLDFDLEQKGFGVFIKPGDRVDLFEITKSNSRLLVQDVKVLLVDSMGLGKVPFRTTTNNKSRRILTLEIPNTIYEQVVRANLNKNLVLTYQNSSTLFTRAKQNLSKTEDNFQKLTFIQGPEKRIIQK
jgi:Flp pilus assembly protein CpaB